MTAIDLRRHPALPARAPAAGACRSCRHFASAAAEIEANLPGLRALGSVYGSVRGADGLCRLHGRYLAAASSCAAHTVAGADRLRTPLDRLVMDR